VAGSHAILPFGLSCLVLCARRGGVGGDRIFGGYLGVAEKDMLSMGWGRRAG